MTDSSISTKTNLSQHIRLFGEPEIHSRWFRQIPKTRVVITEVGEEETDCTRVNRTTAVLYSERITVNRMVSLGMDREEALSKYRKYRFTYSCLVEALLNIELGIPLTHLHVMALAQFKRSLLYSKHSVKVKAPTRQARKRMKRK